MPLCLDFSVYFLNNALFIDQESGSFRAHERPAEEALLLPNTIQV
jgi:hypothetical protein